MGQRTRYRLDRERGVGIAAQGTRGDMSALREKVTPIPADPPVNPPKLA